MSVVPTSATPGQRFMVDATEPSPDGDERSNSFVDYISSGDFRVAVFVILSAVLCFLPLLTAAYTTGGNVDQWGAGVDAATIASVLSSSIYRETAVASLALIVPATLDSLFDVLFPKSAELLARKSVGLGRLERWVFTVGIALPTGTVFFPYATTKAIAAVYFVNSVFAMTALCSGAVLMFLSRKCPDYWTPATTWRTLGCLAAGAVVHSVSCAGNASLVAANGASASVLFAVGYVLLGLGAAQFAATNASWLAQVARTVFNARARTSSSISAVHVKTKVSQAIVPAVLMASALCTLVVAAALPAMQIVSGGSFSEWHMVVINFLIMAASLTALLVEARLQKFQIMLGLDTLSTRRAFVRYVSHEVRTPLNVMSLGLDLLEEELSEDTSAVSEEYLQSVKQVQESCRQAVGVMNDLIQYDSVQDGEIELQKTTVNALQMVRDNIRPFRFQAEQNRVTLLCDFLNAGESDSRLGQWPSGAASHDEGHSQSRADSMSMKAAKLLDSTGDLEVVRRALVDVDGPKINQVIRSLVFKAVECSPPGSTVTVTVRLAKRMGPAVVDAEQDDDDDDGQVRRTRFFTDDSGFTLLMRLWATVRGWCGGRGVRPAPSDATLRARRNADNSMAMVPTLVPTFAVAANAAAVAAPAGNGSSPTAGGGGGGVVHIAPFVPQDSIRGVGKVRDLSTRNAPRSNPHSEAHAHANAPVLGLDTSNARLRAPPPAAGSRAGSRAGSSRRLQQSMSHRPSRILPMLSSMKSSMMNAVRPRSVHDDGSGDRERRERYALSQVFSTRPTRHELFLPSPRQM